MLFATEHEREGGNTHSRILAVNRAHREMAKRKLQKKAKQDKLDVMDEIIDVNLGENLWFKILVNGFFEEFLAFIFFIIVIVHPIDTFNRLRIVAHKPTAELLSLSALTQY